MVSFTDTVAGDAHAALLTIVAVTTSPFAGTYAYVVLVAPETAVPFTFQE